MRIKRYLGMLLSAALFVVSGCTQGFEDRNRDHEGALLEDILKDDYIFSTFRFMQKNTLPVFQSATSSTDEYPSAAYQVQQDLCGNIFAGYTGVTHPNFVANNKYDIKATNWYESMFNDSYSRAINAYVMMNEFREEAPERLALFDIVKVMVMHRVTDTYGPIPYSSIGHLTNPYDHQEDIYKAFFQELGDAIDLLTEYTQLNPGTKLLARFDDIYAGDVNKWIRFANTLRLRLAMRVRYVDPDLSKQQANLSMTHPAGLATRIEDLAQLAVQGIWENPLYMIQYAFNDGDSAAGATLTTYMNAYDDPRRKVYFTPTNLGIYNGVRNGINVTAAYRSASLSIFSKINLPNGNNTPVLWMTPAEAWFLCAEAALYGYIGAPGTAGELYEKGIEVSFTTHGIPAGDLTTYLSNNTSVSPMSYTDVVNAAYSTTITGAPSVKWDDAASAEVKLERIITQKYIAMYPEGQEAWSEFRRTGYPRVIPVAVNNGASNNISTAIQIRRLNYPSQEYSGNGTYVAEAAGILAEESTSSGAGDNGGTKLWWDKK